MHSPREFWKHLMDNKDNCKWKQLEFDPCLFVGEKVICIVYVNDLLFWANDEADITKDELSLCVKGVDIGK